MAKRQSRRDQVMREWSAVPSDAEPFSTEVPADLAASVPGVLKKLGLEERWRHNQIAAAWADVVGEVNARHSQPVAFRRGQLIVGVSHSTWLRELTHLKPQFLEKLRARFGADAPRDILFRIH